MIVERTREAMLLHPTTGTCAKPLCSPSGRIGTAQFDLERRPTGGGTSGYAWGQPDRAHPLRRLEKPG